MATRNVYLDNSATTYVKPEVLAEMIPYWTEKYGNPSSKFYSLGRETSLAVSNAREKVASVLNCAAREIYFTASGSESDNWAIRGAAFANKKKGNHIISTKIEHHAVLHTLEYLEKNGFEVTYLPVNDKGIVSTDDFENAITEKTILASVMSANNEIGTLQPIKDIGNICKSKGILFHTDAVQAVGSVELDVEDLNVDLLSISGHKFGGPKGIGILYIRKGVKIEPLIYGGGQERGMRAGTENVASIVGIAKAIEMATGNISIKAKKITDMRNYLVDEILSKIPYSRLNGDRENRLCGNANFSFQFIEGEGILMLLDMNGISASSGSACTSGALDPSHVLLAIGLPHEIAHGSCRLTLSEDTTKEDIDYTVETLIKIVDSLRKMSPLYEEIERGALNV